MRVVRKPSKSTAVACTLFALSAIVGSLGTIGAATAYAAGAATAASSLDREARIGEAVEMYASAQGLTDREARLAAFGRTERLFQSVIDDGAESADLYANTGTAALQAERLGPAVLAFRRALALDPDHARAQLNLTHARTLLPPWVPRPEGTSVLDSFFFWHRTLSAAERAAAAALCFFLAAAALGHAIRWKTPAARAARNLAVLPALGWIALTASMFVGGDAGTNEAVVVAEEAVGRAADSANAPARFADPLPGGTEVRAVEVRETWVRIELANGRDAWVSRGSVELL